MQRIIMTTIFIVLCAAQQTAAQEKDFTLNAPEILVDSGFLKFLLPRFSLKTGVRIAVQVGDKSAHAMFNTTGKGRPVMEGLGGVFSISVAQGTGDPQEKARRFLTWLFSDVGKRTIAQFKVEDAQVFRLVKSVSSEVTATVFDGNIADGAAQSLEKCGRCHVVGDANRMKGIGSTPSFPLLRGMPDWEERFETFYLRRPHPPITQIEGVTEPFDPSRPASIHPLFLTTKQLEDIFAYVNDIEPADLGADLVVHQ